jgi:hypothetical protein
MISWERFKTNRKHLCNNKAPQNHHILQTASSMRSNNPRSALLAPHSWSKTCPAREEHHRQASSTSTISFHPLRSPKDRQSKVLRVSSTRPRADISHRMIYLWKWSNPEDAHSKRHASRLLRCQALLLGLAVSTRRDCHPATKQHLCCQVSQIHPQCRQLLRPQLHRSLPRRPQ